MTATTLRLNLSCVYMEVWIKEFPSMCLLIHNIRNGCSCDTEIHIASHRGEWHAPLRLAHTNIQLFSTFIVVA